MIDPYNLLEQIVNGLVAGSMYALVGAGLSLVYGTARILNFAHGEFFMVAGYALFICIGLLGIHPVIAALIAIMAVTACAVPFEVVFIRPLLTRPSWEFSTMATTLGLSIVLQNLALKILGENYQTVPYYIEGSVPIAGLQMPLQRLLIPLAALIALAGMDILMRRTRLGRAVRATSEDREAASVLGVPVAHIYTATFALSGTLAGVASVMLAPIQSVNPWMGGFIALKGFVVAVLGGLGNFRGTVIAAMLLGVVEALGVALTSSEWREVFSFAVLGLIVWFRPDGMFAARARRG